MKVLLRELRESDAEISFKWRNDSEIWKYTESRPDKFITPEIEKEWIKGIMQKNDQKRFAICVGDDHKYIGNVQLTDINFDSAQFHIFIGEKNYWGKGVGVKATHLMVKYGFEVLKLHEIFLYVHINNMPAIKVYQKCGFIQFESKVDQIKMIVKK